jgi:hypothetical protein
MKIKKALRSEQCNICKSVRMFCLDNIIINASILKHYFCTYLFVMRIGGDEMILFPLKLKESVTLLN